MEEAINDYIVVKKEIVKEERSAGGIILNVSDQFNFREKFSKKNVCYASVIHENENIPYLKNGDRIVMNPTKGTKAAIDYDEYTVITKDQYIAKIEKDGRFIVPPKCVMVKIRKEDTDSLYSKWITRFDGSKVQLFIQAEPDKDSDRRSKVFVSFGEIVQIGSDVSGIEVGDIGLLDYTVDNDMDNVLYYDEDKNKYIVINAVTTFHEKDEWAYATRKFGRDTLVSKEGDMNMISPLLGMIRGEKLIARCPNVFIDHRNSVIEKKTKSGIIYSEKEEVMERNVLSVSDKSKNKYGIREGQTIVVKDFDIFDIKLVNNEYIQCIVDNDILMGINDK